MAVVVSIPPAQRAAGTYNLPAQVVGFTANELEIAITRAGLPSGPCAEISMELSQDAGVTWQFLGGISLSGGDVIGRDGNIATESVYRIETPINASDRVRAKAVLLQTLTAGVEVRSI